MQTTQERSRTASEELADERTKSLLNARDAIPPAANGLTRRASSARVVYLRNQIGAHKMQPIHTLLAIIEDDFASGVPLSEHVAWIDQLRADVEVMAIRAHAKRHEQPTPLVLVREVMKETTCESRANPAQERVLVEPTNLAALESFAQKGTQHHAQLGTVLRLVRQQIALVKGDAQRRIYGAGRAS
ncbi:hypothetical protein [Humibacter sp.]|uniref:hypothetical protein n=1 Tax=Humibacter sp. TaxID=1940291 RepID=UPI003F7F4153